MNQLTIGQAQKLTAPAPFGLLGTLKQDKSTNLMAISWWTYLTNHPPMIGVCLSNKGLSGTLIKKNGEFTLSIVGESLKESGLKCGQFHGVDIDKAEEFGIVLCDSENVGPKHVKESRVVFECKCVNYVETGDHTFFVGEVVSALGDDSVRQLYAFDGYSRLDTLN